MLIVICWITIKGYLQRLKQNFSKIGMVTDAVFTDFNKDEFDVIGEWMKPFFSQMSKVNL
jgi:hypothetical protein